MMLYVIGFAAQQILIREYKMSRPEGISVAEVNRMKDRLAQIEEQVRGTRLEFSEGVTVRNSTGRSLQLTLSITEKHHHSLNDMVPDAQELTLNSTFKLPNNSAVSHHFTRNGRDYFNPDYESGHHTSNSRELHPSPSRITQREEQKFQSAGSKKRIDGPFEDTTIPQVKRTGNKGMRIEEEDGSDIEQEQKARPFTGTAEFKENNVNHYQSTHTYNGQGIQTFGNINLPLHNGSKNKESLQPSPQVYSYIHQEYRSHHPQVNTSFKKINEIRTNNDSKMITPSKNKAKQYSSSYKDLSNVRATSNKGLDRPIVSSEQPSTSIYPITHEKKISMNKKQNWEVIPNQQSKSKSKSKFQMQNRRKVKVKAEQLYKQRKQNIPGNKSNAKDESRHKRDVDRRFNRFVTATKAANQRSLSNRSLTPKIEAITDRLSTRQRSPCGHFRLYSESKERQSFLRLVNQNPIASKYMCNEERQELFQKLRNDTESVSLWPMKIVNYTYAKLRKSCSVNYSILKE